MIKVNIKSLDNKINNISILGHSGYDEQGKDIVCASVSSIVITTVNAIQKIDDALDFKQESGNVQITVLKHNEIIDLLINNMLDLLNELEQKYGKYIKINK